MKHLTFTDEKRTKLFIPVVDPNKPTEDGAVDPNRPVVP